MSVLSALGKVFGGIIFTLFLVGLIYTSAAAQSTTHDNLQPAFTGLISASMPVNESQFSQTKAVFMQYCQQTGAATIDLGALGGGGSNMTLKCSDIASATSAAQLVQLAAAGAFDSIYYKNYTCDFISCLSTLPDSEKPMMIFSAHANAFLNQIMAWMIAGIVVGLLLLIVSIRKPFGIAKAVGIEMIIAGALSYAGVAFTKGAISANMPDVVAPLVNNLFGMLQSNFVIVLAIGVVLAVAGFVGAHFTKAKTKEKVKKKK